MTNKKNVKEENTIKKLYGKECTLSKEDFVKAYNINENGLSSDEVSQRLLKYGYNEISSTKPKRWYNYFLGSLFSPFNCILLRYCSYTFLHRCVLSRAS